MMFLYRYDVHVLKHRRNIDNNSYVSATSCAADVAVFVNVVFAKSANGRKNADVLQTDSASILARREVCMACTSYYLRCTVRVLNTPLLYVVQ